MQKRIVQLVFARFLRAYVRECYARRDILFLIVLRDVSIRFRQTYAGLAWLLAKPILMTAILTFVFGKISGFESKTNWPFSLIVMLGLIPWQFFSLACSESVASFINNRSLVTHTYFPRALIPLSTVFSLITDFLIPLALVAILMAWHRIAPTPKLLLFPLWLAIFILATSALSLALASINARFRDLQHALPFARQFGLFASPVAYTLSSIPDQWAMLFCLNPFVGLIESFRFIILPGYPLHLGPISWALFCILALSFASAKSFLRVDGKLAEVI